MSLTEICRPFITCLHHQQNAGTCIPVAHFFHLCSGYHEERRYLILNPIAVPGGAALCFWFRLWRAWSEYGRSRVSVPVWILPRRGGQSWEAGQASLSVLDSLHILITRQSNHALLYYLYPRRNRCDYTFSCQICSLLMFLWSYDMENSVELLYRMNQLWLVCIHCWKPLNHFTCNKNNCTLFSHKRCIVFKDFQRFYGLVKRTSKTGRGGESGWGSPAVKVGVCNMYGNMGQASYLMSRYRTQRFISQYKQ